MSLPPNEPQQPGDGQPGQPDEKTAPPTPGQQPPAYGQYSQQPPAYGQYSQQPPAYGQYSQQPQGGYGYPGQAFPQAAAPQAPPKEVNLAFWLILAAGVLSLLDSLLELGQIDQLMLDAGMQDVIAQSEGTIDERALTGIVTGVIVVFSLLQFGLYLLIAFMVKKGKNWARITGTVFAGISVFGMIAALSLGQPLPLIYGALGIAAIVLLFTKPANAFFRSAGYRPQGY